MPCRRLHPAGRRRPRPPHRGGRRPGHSARAARQGPGAVLLDQERGHRARPLHRPLAGLAERRELRDREPARGGHPRHRRAAARPGSRGRTAVNVFPSRILVVDDDPGLRRTLERILREDYPVETVDGATEAKLRLDQETFSLALVDVRLRDGDGYTLCRDIRRHHPETDVILITGSMSEPDEKLFRSLEEGA
ncbi:response regulator, partial [bacterium]